MRRTVIVFISYILSEVDFRRFDKEVKPQSVFWRATMPFLSLSEVGFISCGDNGFETGTANRVDRLDSIIEAV